MTALSRLCLEMDAAWQWRTRHVPECRGQSGCWCTALYWHEAFHGLGVRVRKFEGVR